MDSEITADLLRKHVFHLAGTIGERNVYQPQALHSAEEYIRQVWRNIGYAVVSQEYTAKGVRSANLEIARTGSAQSGQIILVGAHYDRYVASASGENISAPFSGALYG